MDALLGFCTLKAYAKVNLFLQIIGDDKSGKHKLLSFVAFADNIYDIIYIQESANYNVVKYTNCSLNNGNDLITKALDLASVYIKKFFCVIVEKKIPIAAGLGGGSADVAAVLCHLGKRYGIEYIKLQKIATKIGSDIVACMHSTPCIMTGTGQNIIPTKHKLKIPTVFVNIRIKLSTKLVFDAYRDGNCELSHSVKVHDVQNMSVDQIMNLPNDLEKPAKKIIPQIQKVLDLIQMQNGCMKAKMSGSGATCFGIFKDEISAKVAKHIIKKANRRWFVEFSWIS